MSGFPSARAAAELRALLRSEWTVKRQSGSHHTLMREGWPDVVFAFHEGEEIGPRMLARIGKQTGLRPEDLWSGGTPPIQSLAQGAALSQDSAPAAAGREPP